jgi:hypothetical protein
MGKSKSKTDIFAKMQAKYPDQYVKAEDTSAQGKVTSTTDITKTDQDSAVKDLGTGAPDDSFTNATPGKDASVTSSSGKDASVTSSLDKDSSVNASTDKNASDNASADKDAIRKAKETARRKKKRDRQKAKKREAAAAEASTKTVNESETQDAQTVKKEKVIDRTKVIKKVEEALASKSNSVCIYS